MENLTVESIRQSVKALVLQHTFAPASKLCAPEESSDAAAVVASALSICAMMVLVEPSVDHTSLALPAVDGSARHACT